MTADRNVDLALFIFCTILLFCWVGLTQFFQLKKRREPGHESILWTQAFTDAVALLSTFLSHVKYTGTDPTLRRHYVSFTSFHYVFLHQTKPFPTYPTHLHLH